MKINGRELFTTPRIDDYISKFTDKLTESNNKIAQLDSDILRCEVEEDANMTVDILEGTASSKKDLSNCVAEKRIFSQQEIMRSKRSTRFGN